MNSYIKYRYGDEPHTQYVKEMTGCTLDQVLCTASNMYAFDDCTDIDILEVVHERKGYEYCGWAPGMTFTFRDESGEEIWSRSFPQWDH